jgi:DNA-binding protein
MENLKMSKKSSDSNIIYVGRKPPMNYVLGIVTAFSGSETKEITVKARGQAITTAVDAVEIARRRFVKEMKVDKIDIGTEEMPPREGESNSRMISTIEITLKR